MFELDQRLQKDCIDLGSFPLCRLLLMNDKTYPWFILVPQEEGLTELHQLADEQRQHLWQESALLSWWMEQVYAPDKLNVAALGNIVRQLHLHHVARYQVDPAWPGPVWGKGPAEPYTEKEISALAGRVELAFEGSFKPYEE